MSSTSDVFTSIKNIVAAINSASSSLSKNFSNNTALGVSKTALINAGASRLISFSITDPGTTVGYVYDASSIDIVNGFGILSAIANGSTINITFTSGYTFKIGSTVSLKNTAAGLDGAYIVSSSSPGALTALTPLVGNSTTGIVGSGAIVVVLPNELGIYSANWPIISGIVIVPGTGQILSVSWQ